MPRFLPVALALTFLVALGAGSALNGVPSTVLAAPPVQSGLGLPTPAPLQPTEIPPEAFPTDAPAPRPDTDLTAPGSVDLSKAGSVAAAQGPVGVVLVDALNVRAGPSTDYQVIGQARRAETFKILGQTASCGWLRVRLPSSVEGWVSGDPQYVTLNQACAFIPVAPTPPPPPTKVPGSQPARPPAPPSQPGAPSLPANKGCYLFINQLGAEITLTFTAQGGRQWNDTWKLAVNAEKVYCLDPGKYTYTLDAPPPWGSTNGWLDVVAGKHYRFPITPAPE